MNFKQMKNSELHGWCKSSGKQSLDGRKKFIAALPEVYRRHMYKEYGFGSIYEYAAKLCGVSHQMVDDVIRVDEKLKEMPKLRNLIGEVGLSKVRRVASVAKKETENEWVEKVQKMSKPALELHIKESRPGPGLPTTPLYDDFENFTIKLDPEIILKLKIIKQKMGKGTTWNEVFSRLTGLPTVRPQKNPRPSNPKKRHIPTQKRRELEGKCSCPGCNKPVTEIHHKKPWAKFQSHDDLEGLCKGHHELRHQSDSTIDKKYRQYKLALF
ncbi:HNH endonuclease signature motif containing protein [Patescibacteria group bacterium]